MIGLVGSLLETSGGGGGGTPGGSNTQVQFNDAGSFGGDSGLTYNKTTDSLTLAGNQTFSGLAKRILGDFSNATRANRLAVQTSTTNGNTRLPFLPNGTSRLSGIDCHDGTDLDNSSFLQVHSDGTNNHAGLNSSKVGTGTTKDLVFQIDAVTKAKVNAADGKFNVDTLTASQLIASDASKNLQSLDVATYPSLTEISHVKGVTSAIQTQLNSKLSSAITSLNSLTGASQSITSASTGTDFEINSTGTSHIISIPSMEAGITRGLLTNGIQTIPGVKTFSDAVSFGKPNATLANLRGYTPTTTTGGTTTLTNASFYQQVFTGTLTQTIVLPVTSTLQTGWPFKLVNSTNQPLTVSSSGGNLIASLRANTSLVCICVGTTLTTAADWDFGFTDFASVSGDGAVILASNSALINPSATGILGFAGSAASASSFHNTQTTGTLTAGGTAGTGTITVGQSTVSQTTNIQAGATASGSTKTMNIGTSGLAGSTTNISIGSTTGTSITTINGIKKQQNYTVATLPSAVTSGVGARSFVTDALAPGFGATVAGGGAVAVPVYSDGTNWKVG